MALILCQVLVFDMRWVAVSMCLILALTLMPASSSSRYEQLADVIETYHTITNIERNWSTNIILVNYDMYLVNESALMNSMPATRVFNTATATITYNIEYNLYNASSSYEASLRQIIVDHSIVGPDIGTKINETALALQKEDPNSPRTVFESRAGRSIDGYAVEDWLIAHPYVPAPRLGYNFYLLNLSEFDSVNHTMEHWFDYHPIDSDTGLPQDWFRLEFDNTLNPSLAMEYAGFGGRSNIYVLDPSADQWYLRWAHIWWQDYITTQYDHWTKDLEDMSRELDLRTSQGISQLNKYLHDYMYDIIAYLLFPYQHSPAKYVTSGELKIEIVYIESNDSFSINDLKWVTDVERQRAHLEELIPFVDWHVNASYYDGSKDSYWNNTFWAFASVNQEGVTEVSGGSLFDYIYENVRPYRITTGSDNINVYGVVFIKKNMLMYFADGVYTGLGLNGQDGGQTLVCKSLERYYRTDGNTPREGVSGVQLHETMHAIGFAHTWQHEHYASDFSYSPMGYFAMHNGTSTFDRNWAQATYLDQMKVDLWNDFVFKQGYITPENPEKTFIAESRALQAFSQADIMYNEMDWLSSFKELRSARDWTKRMIYSRFDQTPPVIEDWGINPSIQNNTAFDYWVHLSDSSGIENVTLYVLIDGEITFSYGFIYENPNWIAHVPGVSFHSSLTLWIVAWDWAMNYIESPYLFMDVTVPPPSYPYDLLSFMIISGVLGVAAVLVFYANRRQSMK